MKIDLDQLAQAFEAESNEENAIAMKNYMKGKFAYYGIKSPERRVIQKPFTIKMEKCELMKVLLEAWKYDQREFQMYALDLMDKNKKEFSIEDLDFLAQLIQNKSWWDTIDLIASKIVGQILKDNKETCIDILKNWATHENFWIRRTAILASLKQKDQTDTDFISYCILNNLGTTEFFINKAIGWILREYSKTDKIWVSNFIDQYRLQLSGLSIREGSKYL